MRSGNEDADERALTLVAAVRDACARAAAAAYEDAGVRGLCEEGRYRAALGAIRTLDPRSLLNDIHPGGEG